MHSVVAHCVFTIFETSFSSLEGCCLCTSNVHLLGLGQKVTLIKLRLNCSSKLPLFLQEEMLSWMKALMPSYVESTFENISPRVCYCTCTNFISIMYTSANPENIKIYFSLIG